MAGRAEAILALGDFRDDVVAVAESARASAWSNPTDDADWDAHDLLAHIASTSGTAGFILTLASSGVMPGGGSAFDQDEFNRQQVSLRKGRTPSEIIDEIRATIQRDIQAIEAAHDGLLAQEFTAPWGVSGSLSFVITESVKRHLRGHLDELRTSLGA